MASDHGLWRAGAVEDKAFILGEALLGGGQTPSDLLAGKAVAVAPWHPDAPDVTMRFEARGHGYTFSIDGGPVLQVEDDRFSDGVGIGVWVDRTQVAVTDFRLYALAQ